LENETTLKREHRTLLISFRVARSTTNDSCESEVMPEVEQVVSTGTVPGFLGIGTVGDRPAGTESFQSNLRRKSE